MGKFQLPEHPGEGEGEGDNDVVTQTPGDVPEWTHFPDRCEAVKGGEWVCEAVRGGGGESGGVRL